MQKIKIAYVCTPIEFGGAEKVSLNFLQMVNTSHFDISPICLVRPWEEKPLLVQKIESAGYLPHLLPVANNPGASYLRIINVIRKLYIVFKSGCFDLIHTHGYFADICALPVAKFMNIPSISTCHGYINNDNKLKIYNYADKISLSLASKIITVSDSLKNEIQSLLIDEQKIVVYPNAVKACKTNGNISEIVDKFMLFCNVKSSDFIVGYVGRLSNEKGVNYLVDAFMSKQFGGDVKLFIIGDGPCRSELEQKVQLANMKNTIFFTGFQENIEEWLSAFDLFILPSLTEGTPMALLEAMALGLPIIATRVGGIPAIIDNGFNGLLIEPGSVESIVLGINNLKNNSKLRQKLSENAAETINQKYSLDSWCRGLEKIYCSLLHGGKYETV